MKIIISIALFVTTLGGTLKGESLEEVRDFSKKAHTQKPINITKRTIEEVNNMARFECVMTVQNPNGETRQFSEIGELGESCASVVKKLQENKEARAYSLGRAPTDMDNRFKKPRGLEDIQQIKQIGNYACRKEMFTAGCNSNTLY